VTPWDEREAALLWVHQHPGASPAEAFLAGVAYARQRPTPAPAPKAPPQVFAPEGKGARTFVAALTLFRDQVLLALDPDEVAAGEFLSVADVDAMIATFQQKAEAPQ
jgi:hypothetical protein